MRYTARTWWEAVGRRLRRNYLPIYFLLLGSWLVVLMTHPTNTTSLSEIIARARRSHLSGDDDLLHGAFVPQRVQLLGKPQAEATASRSSRADGAPAQGRGLKAA